MTRFFDIDLTLLPKPDAVEAADHATILNARLQELKARLFEGGISFDVEMIKPDPFVLNERHAAFQDMLLRKRINDAALATTLAYATGADLDHKAAELGVVRKVVEADPDAIPPVAGSIESDTDLRRRRQLAIEALSTAGPVGAYEFFTLAAHPHVSDVAVYDPHSELCGEGEVLCVIASSQGDGVPTDLVLDSVADFLDAREINYAVSDQRIRDLDRRQKLRPLNDRVIVEACSGLDYSITALLKIPFGPDPELVRTEAEKRLLAYLCSRRQIARIISDSAIAAAVHVADENGVAMVDDADITITVGEATVTDVIPTAKQLARPTSVVVTYEVIS
ncbi:MAG: hypothetical protein COA37_15235 [Hoeflea sp.]|uniref:baseplate assembly protein n=1 Tax=Hoeflea sp. TaxID=1940281 RepID=UPI000C0EE949|nr:baseplate J/gp47 family protein [Hoeflea sp.]PHR20385.1 MAG: hypothetical protein COA37_15235 [Hoeflea sp.]